MGRIKTTLIKRTARQLVEKSGENFSKDFAENTSALGSSLLSKRMRNMIAGYVTRIKKNTKKVIDDNSNTQNGK
jgi:small subunit ribosomal protein S17e